MSLENFMMDKFGFLNEELKVQLNGINVKV